MWRCTKVPADCLSRETLSRVSALVALATVIAIMRREARVFARRHYEKLRDVLSNHKNA